MQTDLITKVYFNEHLTHSCVGMPQGLQALSSSLTCHSCLVNMLNVFKNDVFFMFYAISGADPGFFPRGGQVGHSATKTPQASQGKVRRGVWGASPRKC